jgi:hypothetical protein
MNGPLPKTPQRSSKYEKDWKFLYERLKCGRSLYLTFEIRHEKSYVLPFLYFREANALKVS